MSFIASTKRSLVGISRLAVRGSRLRQFSKSCTQHSTPKETVAYIEGAPETVKWGLLRISAVVIPFTYLGAMMSKRGAEFLEEWNIFVPEDDED